MLCFISQPSQCDHVSSSDDHLRHVISNPSWYVAGGVAGVTMTITPAVSLTKDESATSAQLGYSACLLVYDAGCSESSGETTVATTAPTTTARETTIACNLVQNKIPVT